MTSAPKGGEDSQVQNLLKTSFKSYENEHSLSLVFVSSTAFFP